MLAHDEAPSPVWLGHRAARWRLLSAVLGRSLLAVGLGVVGFDSPAHGQSEGERTNVVDIGEAVRSVAAAVGPVDAVLAHSVGSPAALHAFTTGLEVRASVHIAGPASLLRVMQGFARGAWHGERLVLVYFTAPRLHFYPTLVVSAQALLASIELL